MTRILKSLGASAAILTIIGLSAGCASDPVGLDGTRQSQEVRESCERNGHPAECRQVL